MKLGKQLCLLLKQVTMPVQIVGYSVLLHSNLMAITATIIIIAATIFTTTIIIAIFNLRFKPTIVNVLLVLVLLIR